MKMIYLLLFLLYSSLYGDELLQSQKDLINGELQNGFKYTIVKNSRPKHIAEIRLYVGAGSLDETKEQRGLAHFVEHMAFNGIRDFKKNELISYLESLGMVFGNDLNANTTEERTLYKLSLPLKGDNLKKAFTVVRDWADGLLFDRDEYNKERNVILEERRLRDSVQKRLGDKYRTLIYGDSLYSYRDPIGSVDVISHSSVKLAKEFYDTWYRPDLMHLVVVGDFNTTKVEEMIKESLSSLIAKSHKRQIPRTIDDINTTQILSISDKELSNNSINIFYITNIPPMRQVSDKRAALRKTIMLMLLNLQAQKQLLKSNPKALQIKTTMDEVSKNRWVHEFIATYKSGNGYEALYELYQFISSFQKYGFSNENFKLAKKLILSNVNKSYARLKDNRSQDIANNLIKTIHSGSIYIDYDYDYNLTKKLLKDISLDEINKTFKDMISIKNRVVLFEDIGGYQFQKDKVLDIFSQAQKSAKDLTKVKKVSSHILDKELIPSKIISKSYNKELDIYSYRLENNITVDFKPNSHNKNLLKLRAFSEGGYSILKGKELKASKIATDIVTMSAPANLTDIELDKIMAGKQVNVSPSIERFGEKIEASCNTKDIEMMFELLYARVTMPKVDNRVLENIKNILINNLKESKNNPEYLLIQDVIKEYYNNNPKLKPLSVEDISQLDAKTILSLYRSRFADINNFHFVISGDATPKIIESMISKYLGNMPTQNREEKYSNIPYQHPKGKVTITKKYSSIDKANITIQYTSKLNFNIVNNISSMIASNILSIRLRNIIREQKSGVYNIDVQREYIQDLGGYITNSIKFICDPKRVDELTNTVYSTIDSIKSRGISSDELSVLKEMINLEYKKQIDQNSFWVDDMMASYRFHTPVDEIIKFPKILDKIDRPKIDKVYPILFKDDILEAILLPKEEL